VTSGNSGRSRARPPEEDVALGEALLEGGTRLEDVALGGVATDLGRAATFLDGAVSSWRRTVRGEESGGGRRVGVAHHTKQIRKKGDDGVLGLSYFFLANKGHVAEARGGGSRDANPPDDY
jgi:hypothetical protein